MDQINFCNNFVVSHIFLHRCQYVLKTNETMIHLSTKLKQNIVTYYIQIFTVLKNHSFNNASSYHIYQYFFSSQQALFLLFFFSAEMAVLFLRSSLSHNPFIDLRPFGKLMLVLLLCNQLGRLGDRHLWYATPTFFCS